MLFAVVFCRKGLAGTSENKRKPYRGEGKTGLALMMSFGINLAVRIYLIGVLFGGWLDRRFGGGNGYVTAAMVVITIFFSIYMLYRDLLRLEKKPTEENDTERDGDAQ